MREMKSLRDNQKLMKKKGQSLVEFALLLPLMVVIIFGVFDIGRLFYSIIVVTNASREGARYAMKWPNTLEFGNVRTAAVTEATNSGITITSADVTISCTLVNPTNSCNRGYPVIVTVHYQFQLIMGWLMTGPINIDRSTQMMVP